MTTQRLYVFVGLVFVTLGIAGCPQPPGDIVVTILPSSLSIEVGASSDLNATSTDSADGFTWSSSDTSVTTVDGDGTVLGVAEGTATITARGTNSGESDSVVVTVEAVGAEGEGEGTGEGATEGEGVGEGSSEGGGEGVGEGIGEGSGEGAGEGIGEGSGEGEGEGEGGGEAAGVSVLETSPRNGEGDVAVTRETIITFTGPLESSTIPANAVVASFGGSELSARVQVSADRERITLFYNQDLPSNARIRVAIDGDLLIDDMGTAIDPDGDGLAGGTSVVAFDTLSLTTILGTSVSGRVFASEFGKSASGVPINVPLQGVTISVDGAAGAFSTLTDDMGNFRLDPAPAGTFFVHVDGRTATNMDIPVGAYYPFVGKSWTADAGIETVIGDVYLPLIVDETLQAVSLSAETVIEFPASVLATDPAFEGVSITVPADSLFADNGTRGGMVGIAPVAPDRLPGPLPEGVNFPIVITVQTDGATNFDIPVSACFPNLPDPITGLTLAPGEKTALWSFNHDLGEFEVIGSMTVSEDGALVCTDPGVGIRAPGWHAAFPGTFGSGGGAGRGGGRRGGGGGEPDPPEDCKTELRLLESGTVQCAAALSLPLFLANSTPGFGCATGAAANAIGGAVDCGIDPEGCGDILALQALGTALGCIPVAGGALGAAWTCGLGVLGNELDYGLCTIGQKQFGFAGHEFMDASPMRLHMALVEASIDYYNALLGSNVWTEVDDVVHEQALQQFLSTLIGAVTVSSDGGKMVTSAELDVLLAIELPSSISMADADALVVRMESMVLGVLPMEELDPDRIESAGRALQTLGDRIDALGWRTSYDGLMRGLSSTFPADVRQRALAFASSRKGQVNPVDLDISVVESPLFYHLTNFTGDFERRGQLSAQGILPRINLASEAFYQIEYLHPETFEYARDFFASSEPGSPTVIPSGILIAPDDLIDSDGDGLHDRGEGVIGTNPAVPDTDEDGILDGAEIRQGLNPLDGLPTRTGVIASAPVDGDALGVCAGNDLVAVAHGATGVSIFNVFNGMQPSIVAQVDTAGVALGIDCSGNLIVVADQAGGVAIIDLTDPAAPVVTQVPLDQFDGRPRTVAISGDRAFVGTDSQTLSVVDLSVGHVTDSYLYPQVVHDVGVGAGALYVLTSTTLFVTEDFSQSLEPTGNVLMAGSASPLEFGRKLAVGDGLVYFGWFNGYRVIDVSVPANPVVVGDPPQVQLAIHDFALNGSGLVIPVTSFGGTATLALTVYDGTDPTDVTQFLDTFDTPGLARAVDIQNGLAYVADTGSGLQVINYLAYDSEGIPPTVEFMVNDGATAVEAGMPLAIRATVFDDTQVRNVEFLIDGAVVGRDGNFPFEATFIAPPLAQQTTVTVAVRAFDTGGNQTTAPEQILTIEADATPPEIVFTDPSERFITIDLEEIRMVVSEPIDRASLNLSGFTLTNLGLDFAPGGGDDSDVTMESVELIDGTLIVLTLSSTGPLSAGLYDLTVAPSVVVDLLGNTIVAPFTLNILTADPAPAGTNAWLRREDGIWGDGFNWADGDPPGAGVMVDVDVPGATITITIDEPTSFGGGVVRENLVWGHSISIRGDTTFFGDITFQPNGIMGITSNDGLPPMVSIEGAITFEGSAGFNVRGDGYFLDLSNLTSIDPGLSGTRSFSASNGATIDLMGLTELPAGNNLNASGDGLIMADNLTIFGGDLFIQTGGTVDLPLLATSTGTLNLASRFVETYPSLASLSGVLIVSATTDATFSAITALDGLDLRVFDGTASFPNLTGAANTAVQVTMGGTLSVPALTAHIDGSLIFADPTTSLIAPNLADIAGTRVTVFSGGMLSLPNVTVLDGLDLRVFDGMASFPNLTGATNTSVTATTGGTLSVPALTAYIDGSLIFGDSATSLIVPNLADIAGTRVTVSSGATLSLPNVTALSAEVSVSGLGSTADFSNVSSITVNAANFQSYQADQGGTLLLPNVTTVDIVSGTFEVFAFSGGTIDLRSLESAPAASSLGASDGTLILTGLTATEGEIALSSATTVFDAPALQTVSDLSVTAGANFVLPSVTTVSVGISVGSASALTLANVTSLDGVAINVNSDSLLTMAALVTAFDTTFDVDTGSTLDAQALESFLNGAIFFDNVDTVLDVPLLSNIDDTTIRMQQGAVLSLPNVTSYLLTETTGRIFQTVNAGTMLDLSGLLIFTINGPASVSVRIEAEFGGVIDMSGLTEYVLMTTPFVDHLANGPDAVLDLRSLTTFDPSFVRFTEQNEGVIALPPK